MKNQSRSMQTTTVITSWQEGSSKSRNFVRAVFAMLCLIVCCLNIAFAQTAYSLAQYQTPFRDQMDRSTCWAFGGVAALEAAYKRKYGLNLDLSEQYAFHMGKVMAFHPPDLPDNNTSLIGYQGASDIVHHLSVFAIPEEKFAPYLNGTQMEQLRINLGVGDMINHPTQVGYDTFELSEYHIPTAARLNAKYRVTEYGNIPNFNDLDALEQTLAANHEIVADFTLHWKLNEQTNIYEYNSSVNKGNHIMLIVGYDRNKQVFIIKNSYGEKDFIRMTYDCMKKIIGGAYYINNVADPNELPQKVARFLGFWNFDAVADNKLRLQGTLVIRRFNDNMMVSDPNALVHLGSLYLSNGTGPYDVTGSFTDAGDGIVLDIHAGGALVGWVGQTLHFAYPKGSWPFTRRKQAQPLAGDFNGDRRTDIALTGPAGWGTLPMAFYNSNGTFTVTNYGINQFATYASQPGATVVTGDFNGDGKTDIVLTGALGWSTIPVAFSNGDGTFYVTNFGGDVDPKIAQFASWASQPGVKVLTGDFNGDGKTDLALTGPAGWGTMPVAFSTGFGTFRVTNSGINQFASWASQRGVIALTGDFNSDGKTDIVLTGPASWGTIPMAFSNGDGTFNVTNYGSDVDPKIAQFASWASQPGVKVLTGDFNGDGKTDLALTGPSGWVTLPVALSTGFGTFQVTNFGINQFADWASQGATVVTGDFNGDGKTDLALTGRSGWGTLPVAFSNGNGTFNVTNLGNFGIDQFAIWASQGAKVVTGDFNGDGKTDIALTGPASWGSLPVAFSNGNGTFNATNYGINQFANWASQLK